MQARLFSRTGETRGTELDLGRETVIGRDRKSGLVIDRPLMSSRHARIFYDDRESRYLIEDLGSLNGTEVDGDRIREPERLGHLHVITFAGTYEFFFLDQRRADQRHPEPPPPLAEVPRAQEPAETAAEKPERPEKKVAPEITVIDEEPVALPDLLARRAKDLDEAAPEKTDRSVEITKIEREPMISPEVLARVVERAETAEETAQPESPAQPEPAAQPGPGHQGTVLEKMPVALPENLAGRSKAPDVHKLETVDLNDIEELIASGAAGSGGVDVGAAPASSELQLIVTEPDGGIRHFPLATGDNLIGRGTRVQVSMIYRDLSRRHAILRVGPGKITLRDLGSRNFTYLDDTKLEPEVEVEIEISDRLRFGSVEARLASSSSNPSDSGDSE